MSNKSDKLSVFISLILRHKPQTIGISLDEFGYANVEELIKGINDSGRKIDFKTLQEIVATDKKGRYSFDESNSFIRANQGHSVNVKVPLREVKPTKDLYHGTSEKSIEDIMSMGIKKMNRLYVHLSDNISTATQVGKRHGKPILLKVDAKKMSEDGYKFYVSENNVWQVKFVPNKYISVLKDD